MRVLNKKTWPYQVECKDAKTLDQAVAWCRETFPDQERRSWCYAGLGVVHFRNEADAAFCELKWS